MNQPSIRRLFLLASAAVFALVGQVSVVLADEAATTSTDSEVIVVSLNIDLPTKEAEAGDEDKLCTEWAAAGECEANPAYMLVNCPVSCGQEAPKEEPKTKKQGRAYLYQGEDAAVGAFRFAENYSSHYKLQMIPTDTVLDIARELQQALPEDYVPSSDITHCGKKKCSAGKLWKRAEEMRKDDMHDAAGADIIRAMLKTGLEVDFVEKCERSLQWAFGSITRQRERERREALEDAKLEKRRQEEMEAMKESEERKKEYEAHFVTFGESLIASLGEEKESTVTVGADGSTEGEESNELIASVINKFTATGPQGGNCPEVLQLLKKISPSDKSADVLLIEARCHEMEGNHKQAMSAASKVISKAANYEPWLNDSPRMMATTLGANSAMQLGLSDNALSFYQNVLKFDPEQERARKQYRGLKKVVKLLGKADAEIKKGYNKAAGEFVNDCLSAMRGLDVDSPLFRSHIQLKQCSIQSGMGNHEEALNICDTALELLLANADVVPAASRKEAHLTRAEALMLDMDYDEAVNDFRSAFDLVPDDDEEKRELNQKLQQAMHQKKLWNGGEMDYRYNPDNGFPEGRPPERDHAKILELPIDLEQRSKEVRCAWLKKQFKALVRRHHPDKTKGNKKRAARKFKEVKEAKEIISKQWQC